MASAEKPATPPAAQPTAVKPGAPVHSADVKPLPPPPLSPLPERAARRLRVLDGVLVGLVLLFAFLVSLFPAHNSDFFLHAAAGRLIAHGQYQIGVDPFAFTTEGVYWVNHNWLYDLLTYLIYATSSAGGTILIVLKALMIVALAEVMLRAGRVPGRGLWVPAVCVGLAVLTISPRVFLQPVCVSFLFLGLTYWLLLLPGQMRERGATPRRPFLPYWLIPPLCLLWVNLDVWFFLGPATVALYLLGETLQGWLAPPVRKGPGSRTPGEIRTLLLVLIASVAACLVNPHHVWAFTLPSQLGFSDAARAVQNDPQFQSLFYTPFEKLYFYPTTGLSVAGLAFFPLALLGVISIAAGQWMGCWRWQRAILWTAFLVLSAWHARAIPFFAVVAGPITSLNFLDFAARCFGSAPLLAGRGGAWALGGRYLTAVFGVLLLVAAWPGWLQALQPPPQEWRRVGWTVEPDPALENVVKQIAAWRDARLIEPGGHWFNTSPEVLYYLAWYCPGERGFIDHRLSLYERAKEDFTAEDFETIRTSLAAAAQEGGSGASWRNLFRRRHAHALIWFDRDPVATLGSSSALPILLSSPDEWPPLHDYNRPNAFSRAAAFGWRDPAVKDVKPDAAALPLLGAGALGLLGSPSGQGPFLAAAALYPESDPFSRIEFNSEKAAFGSGAAPAPPRPPPEPQPHEWWSALWATEPPRPADADEAAVELVRFVALQVPWRKRNEARWDELWTEHKHNMRLAAAVACIGPGGPGDGVFQLEAVHRTLAMIREQSPMPSDPPQAGEELQYSLSRQLFDFGPPDALYLSLRAGRRALAVKPDDAQTYQFLAQAYQMLVQKTREGAQAGTLVYPIVVRRVQRAAALRRAIDLNPDLEGVRILAFQLHAETGFLDLAAVHARERLHILRTRPGADAQQSADNLEKQIDQLDKSVSDKQTTYELRAAGKPVLDKVDAALKLGLGQTALDVLEKVDWKTFAEDDPGKVRGVQKELSLLLQTGHAEEVGKTLIDEEKNLKETLGLDPDTGLPAYEWLRVQAAAAVGDYAGADQWLEALQKRARRAPRLAYTLQQLRVYGVGDEPAAADLGAPSLAALLTGHMVLQEAPAAVGARWLPFPILFTPLPPYAATPTPLPNRRDVLIGLAGSEMLEPLARQSDLDALRGWLALEAGDIVAARRDFEKAVNDATPGPIAFHGRALAQQGLEWLDAAK